MNAPTIASVPESITRSQAVSLIESLGIDPSELVNLKFEVKAVTAEVYALNKKGNKYLSDKDTVATHKISIPILDGDDN